MASSKGSILITGANGGLGSAIVSRIVSSPLSKDYCGLYTVRNPATATELDSVLRKAPPVHRHETVPLDLASLAAVRQAAALLNKRVAAGSLPRIRALVLNAGYQGSTEVTMSDDGFEMTFQVNYLSHFLLTLLLLESMDKEHGRIVVVGSCSHDPEDARNETGIVAGSYSGKWSTLFSETDMLARGQWSRPEEDPTFRAIYRRYGASKLCEVMFMHELQKRLSEDTSLANISVLGVDPGAMGTGLMRNGSWLSRTLIMKVAIPAIAPLATRLQPNGMLRTPAKSAADVLRACFDTETLGEHPRALYLNGTEAKVTSAEARDPEKRERLWRDSTGYLSLRDEDTALEHWK